MLSAEDRARSDAVFAPPGTTWQRVSPRLATARRLTLSAVVLVAAAALLVLSRAAGGDGGARLAWALAGLAAVLASGWVLVGRQVAAYGWVERDDDLVVVSGVAWRRLVVVPYGRMQYVDVTAGPVERWLGIATVQLHTGTPATSAAVPGLPPAEAAALRDRLAALGEARAAGL